MSNENKTGLIFKDSRPDLYSKKLKELQERKAQGLKSQGIGSAIREKLQGIKQRLEKDKLISQVHGFISEVTKTHHLEAIDELVELQHVAKLGVLEVRDGLPLLTEQGAQLTTLYEEVSRKILFSDFHEDKVRPHAQRVEMMGELISLIEMLVVGPMLDLKPDQVKRLSQVYRKIVLDPQDGMGECFEADGRPKSQTDEEAKAAKSKAIDGASNAAIRQAVEMVSVIKPELSTQEREEYCAQLLEKVQPAHVAQIVERLLKIKAPNVAPLQIQTEMVRIFQDENTKGYLGTWETEEKDELESYIAQVSEPITAPLTPEEETIVALWTLSVHSSWLRIQPDRVAFEQMGDFAELKQYESELALLGENPNAEQKTQLEQKIAGKKKTLRLYKKDNKPSPVMKMNYYVEEYKTNEAFDKKQAELKAFSGVFYILFKDFIQIKKRSGISLPSVPTKRAA